MLNLSHSSVYNGVGASGSIAIQKGIDAESDVDVQQYYTEWEYKLKQIYYHERITLLIMFYVVTAVAIIGNILTLYVVITRKQRLLFKTCLLSLSLSDLIYAVTSGANYISKLSHEHSAIWYLGSFMCSFLPFFQTTALLSGSLSLVSIALDRYMAIFSKRKAQWQPGLMFCAVGFAIIWSISAALSCPMLFSYKMFKFFIVPEVEENYYVGYYCIVESKIEVRYYYSIIFTFVFLPIMIAFTAFNAIIAREIWRRRKMPGSKRSDADESSSTSTSSRSTEEKNMSDSKTSGTRNNSAGSKDTISKTTNVTMAKTDHCNQRLRRQMRMFKVILVLMCVFIVLKLPTWIFLLYKLYNFVPTNHIMWLITYILGMLGIMNSMANPFLYTFLSETIRFTSYIHITCCKFCKLCRPKKADANYANNAIMFAKNDVLNKQKNDNGGVYLGN